MVGIIDEIWAVALLFVQAWLIILAVSYPPGQRCLHRGRWAWFVLMLCSLFLGRLIFTLRCFDVADFWPFQHIFLTITSACLFMFVRGTKDLYGP